MGETIADQEQPIELSEEAKRALARQALRATVPPLEDDKYQLLVEL